MRCFVAVLPPADTADQIERCLDALCANSQNIKGARRVAKTNLHLTLAFIGALPKEKAHALAHALAQLPQSLFPPFEWVLDHAGVFHKARVLWLAGASSPTLEAYQHTVQSTLEQLHIPFDARPWAPHVTVLRHFASAADAPQMSLQIPWPLSRPVLMESTRIEGICAYRVVL